MTLILSVGRDPLLMKLRTMLLQRSNYQVAEAYSGTEAARRLRSTRFSLVLICHTLSSKEQIELVARARRIQPGIPIVCVGRNGYHSGHKDCEIVDNMAPTFISDLRRILQHTRMLTAS